MKLAASRTSAESRRHCAAVVGYVLSCEAPEHKITQNNIHKITLHPVLTVLVLMVSSATAFNNWKAKLALFSVFIRSYVDGSHLDPVSTCLTREKKKKCVL